MTISSDAEQEHAIGLDDLIKLSDELSQKIRNFKKQGYKRLHGFVVTQSRGYWKAVRNINGKCVSVHLGREYDPDIADQKILKALQRATSENRSYRQ